ncbi:MAG: protein kinase [bacterium]|nr:protein kinase [bacterium]
MASEHDTPSESESLTIEELQALIFSSSEDLDREETPVTAGYELLEEIGSGTSGRVFRARDRALRREVAVKICSSTKDPARRARVLREARSLAKLDHPNIVRVYAVEDHVESIMLILELVRGRTLQEVVEAEGVLSAEQAAQIGIDLCGALTAMHSKGLVHRDVKHANVMREEGGRIVLLDFGFSRQEEPSIQVQSVAGTPAFMAPEQLAGSESAGPTSDLFSLGVLLYYLVSGRYPVNASSLPELQKLALRPEVYASLRERSLDLPEEFVALVDRAIAVEQDARWSTTAELERALRDFVGGRVARPKQTRRSWSAAIAAIGLAAVAVVTVILVQSSSPSSTSTEARFVALRDAGRVTLSDGQAVRLGDLLELELELSEPRHVYFVGQDASGQATVLFPIAGYDLGNPVPARTRIILPGTRAGRREHYTVTSPSSREGFLLLSFLEPIEEVETALAERARTPDGRGAYLPIDERLGRALKRGVGLTGSSVASVGGSPFSLLDDLERLARESGQAVETVRWSLVGAE